ncbi:hypothetical protein V8G54_022603, partial [Vigna mungo]
MVHALEIQEHYGRFPSLGLGPCKFKVFRVNARSHSESSTSSHVEELQTQVSSLTSQANEIKGVMTLLLQNHQGPLPSQFHMFQQSPRRLALNWRKELLEKPIVSSMLGGEKPSIRKGYEGCQLVPEFPRCWVKELVDLLLQRRRRQLMLFEGRRVNYGRRDLDDLQDDFGNKGEYGREEAGIISPSKLRMKFSGPHHSSAKLGQKQPVYRKSVDTFSQRTSQSRGVT